MGRNATKICQDIKDLLNSLKLDNTPNQERNSIVDQIIASLDKPLPKYPGHLLNNLAVSIRDHLFENHPSLFSKDEKENFESKFVEIIEKTKSEYDSFQKELLNQSVNEVNPFSLFGESVNNPFLR